MKNTLQKHVCTPLTKDKTPDSNIPATCFSESATKHAWLRDDDHTFVNAKTASKRGPVWIWISCRKNQPAIESFFGKLNEGMELLRMEPTKKKQTNLLDPGWIFKVKLYTPLNEVTPARHNEQTCATVNAMVQNAVPMGKILNRREPSWVNSWVRVSFFYVSNDVHDDQ